MEQLGIRPTPIYIQNQDQNNLMLSRSSKLSSLNPEATPFTPSHSTYVQTNTPPDNTPHHEYNYQYY